MKLSVIFLIFFFLGISSCNSDENPPVSDACSVNNPAGKCKDNKSCVNGRCIYECSDTKECPENYHCDNNICYDTTKSCAPNNFFGVCPQNETCVKGRCKNLNPCSESNQRGICSSEDRSCYKGICVTRTNECKPWNINGVCPDSYHCSNEGKCIHDKIEYPCSLQYPDGKCSSEFDSCINGLCMDTEYACGKSEIGTDCPEGQSCSLGECVFDENKLCSVEYPFGYCKNSNEKCYDGVCYNLKNSCSETDKFGKCDDGKICKSGDCVAVLTECDDTNPCPDVNRQSCIENKCIDKPVFCKDGAINGLCPEGKACVESECKDITEECTPSNLSGKCNALNLKCINGACLDSSQVNICSDSNLNGECPDGTTCNNGNCEGNVSQGDIGSPCVIEAQCKSELLCEKTFLDGYCTKECNDNADCNEDSSCYKVSGAKGYCLAKCSVNIPNSCARNNLEDYICYPVNGNEGVCLYDCKYNNCFETGKTCNSLTGICQ